MKSDNFLIFQPAKSAMQSGIGKSEKWCLSNSVANETFINSVFCWTGSSNPESDIKIFFDDLDSAIRFAKSKKIDFEVINTPRRKVIKKSYSSNFIR